MSSGSALPQVERLFRDGTVSGLSEAALLERFLSRRDELAFEALVARHGPLVLGVCRRLLRDPGDVEDAFQATFLVLVRKARSIRERDALGPWLYGVAYRIARRSRSIRIRQHRHEGPLGDHEPAGGSVEPTWRELRGVLDEELARLPERYRAPLVLCYLQGLTHDEAAVRLGCPVGTVRSRLARGRERLSTRLARRGLAPTAGLLGGSLAAEASGGALPPALLAATVRVAGQVAQGCAVGSVVSVGSAVLIEGVRETMWWKTWVKGTLAVFLVTILVAGAYVAGRRSKSLPAVVDPYEIKTPKNVRRPSLEPYPAYVVEPPDVLVVEVFEALPGRPISGERLVRPDGTISLGFYGEVYVAGLTVQEAKEKIVLHLRKYLKDEALGLWAWVGNDAAMCEEAKKRMEMSYFKNMVPPFTSPDDDDDSSEAMPPPPAAPPFTSPDGDDDDSSEAMPPPPVAPSHPPFGPQIASDTRAPNVPPAPPAPSIPNEGQASGHHATPKSSQRKNEGGPMAVAEEDVGQANRNVVWMPIYPKDTDIVFVDISSYNSKFYHVTGMCNAPGRIPCTGKETVLDAIENASGLSRYADEKRIRLIRPGKGNEPDQVLPVDYPAIAYGNDPTTNYQIFPGDRIVVPANRERIAAAEEAYPSNVVTAQSPALASRIERLEEKLDAVLKALSKPRQEAVTPRPTRAKGESQPEAAEPRKDVPPRREQRSRPGSPPQPPEGG